MPVRHNNNKNKVLKTTGNNNELMLDNTFYVIPKIHMLRLKTIHYSIIVTFALGSVTSRDCTYTTLKV